MSTPAVTDVVRNPDGTIPADSDLSGHVRLIASTTGNAPGYVETSGGQTVVGSVPVSFVAGALKSAAGSPLTLHPNSGAGSDCIGKPSGTTYEYVYKIAGQKQVLQYLTVTDVVGPVRVQDILASAPGALASAASKIYTDAETVRATAAEVANTALIASTATKSVSRLAGGLATIWIGDSNGLGFPLGNTSAGWWNENSAFTQAIIGSRGMIRWLDNQSVAGTGSDTGLTRLTTALAENPQLIVWSLGTNDALVGLTFQQSCTNVTAAITACQTAGVPIIIVTPPPRSDGNATYLTRVRNLAEWQRSKVRRVGSTMVMLADQQAVLTDPATGAFNTADTYDTALHLSAAGAQKTGQLIVDCVETYFRHKGTSPLTIFDGDTTTNTLTGGNFTQALVGGAPPGWTQVTGGGYTSSLVAPTAADHAVQQMPGNFFQLACANVATGYTISQVSSLTPTVGNIIGFSGRIKMAADWVGDGGPAMWITFTSTIAGMFPIAGGDGTIGGITAGQDGFFYMERPVPAGCTAIKVWAGVQKNTAFVSNMTGTVGFGAIAVSDQTALNWSQYG
jgi:lysophospholipase L1-like esterase